MALACILAQGCTSADPCDSTAEVTLEVGGGLNAFEVLGDPAQLDLVYGPQGGVHVEVSLLATGLDASTPWGVSLSASQDGVLMGTGIDTLPAPSCSETGGVVSGLRLVFEGWVRPSDFEQPLDIAAEATDQQDNVGEAVLPSVWVLVP